jgi:hypothetical protein
MAREMRSLVILLVSLAAVVFLAGCGSASSTSTTRSMPAARSSHVEPTATKTAVETAKQQVLRMILTTGDLGAFKLQSRGGETLKEQLPPKAERGYGALTRLVKETWLASEHSVVVYGGAHIQSNVNLFKSSAAVAAIFTLERHPGRHLLPVPRWFPTPVGAPPGADFTLWRNRRARVAIFQLGWQDSATMDFERAYITFPAKFTAAQIKAVGRSLALAAQAQSARIHRVVTATSNPA